MSAYGWTLDQALDITLPQTIMLFRNMTKYPPPAMVVGMFIKGLSPEAQAEKHIGSIASIAGEGEVKTAQSKGKAFWEMIGVAPEENDG